jgi:hypothetical protein
MKERIVAAVSSRRLRCRWHELPGQSERGLAMNVASSPWRAAISLTALLSRNASSAACSAGAARRLISSCPGPDSGLHASTASPYSRSVSRTELANGSCRDPVTTPYTLGRSSTAMSCDGRLPRTDRGVSRRR